ncbi:enoyl-CoA hydratase [Herbaspirillum rubrisubalbicans]|uniref:enoyl-CoA hydratase n=1 Tax=Herbaspirillum rubrisubalbicans TaxID=80842 RepID=UPI00209E2DFA|nr:enoyl-CoA hydratase [Herbaspirillum rubrisubalbicans]MCP1572939.1 enoyl-CoA hydratase [Herbaspirillum rubrisubalbicans]
MTYENILVETHGRVGLIALNRPKAYNALNDALMDDLTVALEIFESDPAIGAIVLTGSDKAFAAGADIKMMHAWSFTDVYRDQFITSNWERVTRCRKPVIAAVAGLALGGGCELAMMCDFVLAADNARFALPELSLATIPGAGGTQRLTRAIGKSKAMEMVLSGRQLNADEADRFGLVSRVLPLAELRTEALAVAAKIAAQSLPATMMAKECVNRAFEGSLAEGLQFERRMAYATFACADHKEGLAAFIEKRPPVFQHK